MGAGISPTISKWYPFGSLSKTFEMPLESSPRHTICVGDAESLYECVDRFAPFFS